MLLWTAASPWSSSARAGRRLLRHQGVQRRGPTFDVGEIVDATGAGDAFLAATLVHLSDETWNEERVREATLQGLRRRRPRLHRYGAMRALPTKEELEQFMEANRNSRRGSQ